VYLVDTSVWIEFLRPSGSKEIQRRLQPLIRAGSTAVTEWVILELMTGLRSNERASTLLDRFQAIEFLSLPQGGWQTTWNLAARLRKKGISVSAADLLIAAVATSHDATLVHCDSDFESIALTAQLRTMSWIEYLKR
jgi:predicted nucleic acid-binding protein